MSHIFKNKNAPCGREGMCLYVRRAGKGLGNDMKRERENGKWNNRRGSRLLIAAVMAAMLLCPGCSGEKQAAGESGPEAVTGMTEQTEETAQTGAEGTEETETMQTEETETTQTTGSETEDAGNTEPDVAGNRTKTEKRMNGQPYIRNTKIKL